MCILNAYTLALFLGGDLCPLFFMIMLLPTLNAKFFSLL
jgi:hypothetical protein